MGGCLLEYPAVTHFLDHDPVLTGIPFNNACVSTGLAALDQVCLATNPVSTTNHHPLPTTTTTTTCGHHPDVYPDL